MKKLTESIFTTRKMKRIMQIAVLSGSILFLQGCTAHYVAQVPVAPVEVVPSPPYAGAVWINGGWGWRGGVHAWSPGYYSRPRSGRVYSSGEWRHGPRGHYYVRGRWR
jgi:hypothetical protein